MCNRCNRHCTIRSTPVLVDLEVRFRTVESRERCWATFSRRKKYTDSSRMPSKVLRSVWISTFRCGAPGGCRFYSGYVPGKFVNKLPRTMPKDREQLLAIQRQREKMKMKVSNYQPTRVSLQILGSGARGAPRSLYVSTDHKVYIFNCGEGTQRLCYEHRLRLSKLENIFVTTPSWRNMGGLPGMALTVQDNGVPSIAIHGPKGSVDLFMAMRRFVTLKELRVSEATCSADEPFVDHVMSVRYVPLNKPSAAVAPEADDETIPVDNEDYYAYDVNQNGKRPTSQERNRRKIPRTEDLVKGGLIVGSMAYVCKLPPKKGCLLLDKCVDKGVTPGPMLGRLKAGEDVTLANGDVVRSVDVCTPSDPGPVFIVLECPDEEYLESLLSCEAFAKHQAAAAQPEDVASCVVHFTPAEVVENPRYREWMDRFGPTTKHMLINENNRCIGSNAVHRLQHKLHLLHPTIFPFISEEGMAVDNSRVEPSTETLEEDILGEPRKRVEEAREEAKPEIPAAMDETSQEETPMISGVKTLDAFHLRPRRGFDTSGELVLTPRAYINEVFAVDGFLDSLAELQTEINARTKSLGEAPEYPKIVMLGTGSSIPNKTRNTSGILLRIDEDNSVIMDCGEGTMGQLVRFYGQTDVDKVLASIKAIYVSHLHADHHLGLIGLLSERDRVTKQPVMLLAPEQIGSWLRIYNRRIEKIDDKFQLIPNHHFDMASAKLAIVDDTRMQNALKGVTFSTTHVTHCPHAFGVAVTLENGLKIVYSGDCMPCQSLVDLGANCDVLIHEATMEDDLEAEARAKYHSTISQAIEIGQRMKAKFTLLTHFSQRYSKLPVLPENGKTSDLSRVGIAYDNMQISVSQLPLLPLMYPALNVMFADFRVLLEDKAMKRQVRLEREMRQRDSLDMEKVAARENGNP